MDSVDSIRLNKYLAQKLGISRRKADELIDSGKVTINGAKVSLGSQINLSDEIAVNGKQVESGDLDFTYIMLHKPVGYVSSRKQQGDTPTIYELVPQKYRNLKTVGRLDKDSSGLILLTNDGDFTQSMTHPSFYKIKKYNVSLSDPLQPLHQQMISDFGVELPDGPSKMSLERVDESRKNWIVTMSEGRNRQIRRTFASLGYTVTDLHRTDFGPYNLGDLSVGEVIEVQKL